MQPTPRSLHFEAPQSRWRGSQAGRDIDGDPGGIVRLGETARVRRRRRAAPRQARGEHRAHLVHDRDRPPTSKSQGARLRLHPDWRNGDRPKPYVTLGLPFCELAQSAAPLEDSRHQRIARQESALCQYQPSRRPRDRGGTKKGDETLRHAHDSGKHHGSPQSTLPEVLIRLASERTTRDEERGGSDDSGKSSRSSGRRSCSRAGSAGVEREGVRAAPARSRWRRRRGAWCGTWTAKCSSTS